MHGQAPTISNKRSVYTRPIVHVTNKESAGIVNYTMHACSASTPQARQTWEKCEGQPQGVLTLYLVPLIAFPRHAELVGCQGSDVPRYIITHTLEKKEKEKNMN